MARELGFWRNWNRRPFGEIMDMQRSLDSLMSEFQTPWARDLEKYGFQPGCEVSEDKATYKMKFDLPGIPKEAVKIELHDNTLTVSGERKEEKKPDDKNHFSEITYGSFMRSFTFPTAVDAEKTEARYENGTLQLTVPKTDATRARQIAIR